MDVPSEASLEQLIANSLSSAEKEIRRNNAPEEGAVMRASEVLGQLEDSPRAKYQMSFSLLSADLMIEASQAPDEMVVFTEDGEWTPYEIDESVINEAA